MSRHHGLLFAFAVSSTLALGCTETAAPPAKSVSTTAPAETPKPAATEGEHSHGAGPHGGAVGDLGNGSYHFEFTVDHPKKEATVYVLNNDPKNLKVKPVKVEKLLLSIDDPKFDVDLVALPEDGEKDGMSSRFVGKHDNLGVVQEFSGTVTAEVDGTPLSGKFKEEPAKEEPKK